MEHGDGEEIYCICRSSDCSTFMIGCDQCNEWYHGDCINITQEEANFIKHFYCHICRGKDPNLKIRYKHKKKDKDSDQEWTRKHSKEKKHHSDKHHSDKHDKHRSDKHRSDKRRDKHDKLKDRHKKRDKSSKEKHEKRPKPEKTESMVERAMEKLEKIVEKLDEKPVEKSVEKPVEKPMEKPAPPVPPSPVPVPVTTSSVPKTVMSLDDLVPDDSPTSTKESRSAAAAKKSSRRCGQCIACHRNEDCSRCDFCKDMRKFGGQNRIRQKCRLRQCLNFGLLKLQTSRMNSLGQLQSPGGQFQNEPGLERSVTSITELELTQFVSDSDTDDQEFFPEKYSRSQVTPRRDGRQSESDFTSPGRGRPADRTKKPGKKPRKEPKKTPNRPRAKRKHEEDIEDVLLTVTEDQSPRQCLGPGCKELAREGSKYCSDDCGMKLATNRMFEILPQRIQQWQTSRCIAEEKNKLSLETIRHQQLQARQRLVELDHKHQELDVLIQRAKHATATPEQENTDGEDEGELNIHCVTCGHEVPQRNAVRHMERCFTKFESQTSFGSIYKTRIEGNSMFCDFYNTQTKTYCKRLKVLCPEHSKEPKVGADDVCGCPLMSNIMQETKEFCRTQKRKCNKHFCWEKLRRAEIDMERVRQWMKLDDLFEQERNIRVAMSSRAGVLGLMLHQTIDHDPLKPIKSKS